MRKNERILFRRILFVTDLSPQSGDALDYALALARSYNAQLLVCQPAGSRPAKSGAVEGRFGKLMTRQAGLDVAPHTDWESIEVEGDVATEVARMASERGVDLIVLPSPRSSGVAAVLDPTAEAITRTAPCPVFITHPQQRGEAEASGERAPIERILVAYDFSGDSELALTYGLSLAQEFQAELHLLHVLAPLAVGTSPTSGSAFQAAANRLHRAVPAETRLWSEVKQVVSQGPPYREILVYAREHRMDLVCIGASGAGFGLWALFGSNTDRILRQAPCPVLIARPLKPLAEAAGYAFDREATA
jgi:nucleotide-binding universal stress UspA family protein